MRCEVSRSSAGRCAWACCQWPCDAGEEAMLAGGKTRWWPCRGEKQYVAHARRPFLLCREHFAETWQLEAALQKAGDILQSSAPRRDDDRCITSIVPCSHDLFIVYSVSAANVCTEAVAGLCCNDIDVLTFLLDVGFCFNIFIGACPRSLSFEVTPNRILHTAGDSLGYSRGVVVSDMIRSQGAKSRPRGGFVRACA